MELFIQKIISSIVQILLFALIPFVWWCITARKKINFFQWIGLKRFSPKENKTVLWIAGTTIVFLAVSVFILYTLKNTETATSEFSGLGFKALPAVPVYAVLNTSFPEELLFRGFLLKRLSNKFGFTIGNTVQSLLFGLMHGVMFFRAGRNTESYPYYGIHGSGRVVYGICERAQSRRLYPAELVYTRGFKHIFRSLFGVFAVFISPAYQGFYEINK